MQFEKNRHLNILFYLLNAERPVTSAELADYCMASLRTIKSDVVYLNKELGQDGSARIASRKAVGYVLEVIDEEKFAELKNTVTILKDVFHNSSMELVNRRLYIVQKLLMEDYVKVEDIARQLYVSKSTISKELSWSVRFLKSFDIEVVSTPKMGLIIQGREQDIRSAMVEVHASQYHDFQQLYPLQEFNDLFYQDRQVYEDIRHHLLAIIRSSKITITDLASKEVATHICLLKNRIENHKAVQLEERIQQEIRNTTDYQIAKQILWEDAYISSYVKADEMEVVELARKLLISRDIDMRANGYETLPLHIVLENSEIFHKIISDNANYAGASLFDMEFFKFYETDFESLQMRIYLQHLFDQTKRMKIVTYVEGRENYLSPLSMEMARIMILRLQEMLGNKIQGDVIISYACLLDYMLKKIDFPFKRLRIAVTSTEGLVNSQYLRQNILASFQKYIEYMDVFNLYEMRRINFDNYDYVLHSGFILYYNYPIPSVSYQHIIRENSYLGIFEELISKGFKKDALQFCRKNMHIFHKEKVRSLESFTESLSFKYAIDDEAQEKLIQKINACNRIISYTYAAQGVFLLSMPYSFVERNVLDIYALEQSAYDEDGNEINTIIVISIDNMTDLGTVRLIDSMLKEIIFIPENIGRLRRDKEGTLEQMHQKIIRDSALPAI